MNAKKILAVVLAVLMIVGVASGIMVLAKGVSNEIYIPALQSTTSSIEEEMPQEVTFTIGNYEYTVPNGTTWSTWVEDEVFQYNLYVDSNNFVTYGYNVFIYTSENKGFDRVFGNDLIEVGTYDACYLYTTFTYFTVEYQAETGMTWYEWCYSDYNLIDGFVSPIDGEVANSISGKFWCRLDGEKYVQVYSTEYVRSIEYTLLSANELASQ